MNRIYRVIFNIAVGAWQVVSELVSAPRGIVRGGTSDAVVGTVPPLRFALWCALGMVTLASPLMAQESQGRILVDRGAPGDQRPMVIEAPSGAPLVQITAPSAAGVSRNRYSQFDVGSQGAILNNSRTGADTVLGAQVMGNPFLAAGTAKVILNEVNGPASQLNGFVEVAGDRAAVVIANPAGIQTNGAGFINASRVTLTTGTPVFNGGSLDGYRVGQGTIRMDGAGLDTGTADYTDLIARSLELNGKVWAQELRATLGTNTVSADHAQITTHAAEGTLNGTGGTLGSNGALDLTGDTLDLDSGTTFAESIRVDAGTLRTAGGLLSATGTDALHIIARDAVDNAGGTIATNGALTLTVGTTTVDACDGRILIAGDGCGVLNNTGGTISVAGTDASTIIATGLIDNSAGLIPDPSTL